MLRVWALSLLRGSQGTTDELDAVLTLVNWRMGWIVIKICKTIWNSHKKEDCFLDLKLFRGPALFFFPPTSFPCFRRKMFLSKGQRKNFKNKRIQHKDAMVQNSTSVVAAVVEWVKVPRKQIVFMILVIGSNVMSGLKRVNYVVPFEVLGKFCNFDARKLYMLTHFINAFLCGGTWLNPIWFQKLLKIWHQVLKI